MAEIYFSNAMFGCIPNCDTPEVMARIKDLATPWDGKDIEETPDVITYESFEKALETMPDVDSRWWEKYKWEDYVITSQSYRPNCAGCAEATATVTRTLIQAGSQYSEQLPKKLTAIPWAHRTAALLPFALKELIQRCQLMRLSKTAFTL